MSLRVLYWLLCVASVLLVLAAVGLFFTRDWLGVLAACALSYMLDTSAGALWGVLHAEGPKR